MPTAGELTIILEAQDRASAQLRQVGTQVERLERQVQGVSRGGGVLGGLGLGAGFAAAQQALQGLSGIFGFVRASVIDLNSELERTTTAFEQVTGSADAARDVVAALRAEAARSPFTEREVFQAGTALISVAQRSTESVRELVRAAEVLATMDPAQGLEGAAFALREALGGNLESLAQRFEVSAASIRRFIDQGLTPLQAILAELRQRGFGEEAIERFGRTLEGRLSTVRSFGDELRQRLGAGVFASLSDFLGRAVRLIEQYGDRLRAWAEEVGAAIGGLLERLAARFVEPLLSLLDRLAPGFREVFQAVQDEAAPAAAQLERTAQATETVERQLGRLGVAAAELQLDADRVRRSYDDQLEPLERQLRLLQQSADVQRVQNALATNRATVERLRLEREITALQRAARGAEDPNAPGLTARQRAIALALEERRLRLEELGLTEAQRPAVQSLEQQIAALQEQQRAALAPLERQLAIRKEEIDWLQLQRDKQKETTDALAAGVARANEEWKKLKNDPETLQNARQRGEELAQEWLDGWRPWLEQQAKRVWGWIKTTYDTWYAETGKTDLERMGTEIGTTVGGAIGPALWKGFQTFVRTTLFPGGTPQAGGSFNPGASLPRVGFDPTGNMGRGEGPNVTVNVDVTGDSAATREARLQAIVEQEAQGMIAAIMAAEGATDPGASGRLQGAGRTP